MKMATIWTLPSMTLAERMRRTRDALACSVAAHLPKRIQYLTYIHVGSRAMTPRDVVPEVTFMQLLERAEGGPMPRA